MKKFLDNKWLQFIGAVSICLIIAACIGNINYFKRVFAEIWEVCFPCTLGIIIAVFLNRPVMRFELLFKKSEYDFFKKRALGFGILCVFIILIAAGAVAVNFIVPPLYRNIQEFTKNLPSYYEVIKKFIQENNIMKNIYSIDLISDSVNKVFNHESITKCIGFIRNIANSFLSCFVGVVLSVYLLLDKKNIFSFLNILRKKIFPGEKTAILIRYIRTAVNMFYSYFSGLFLDAFIMGAVCTAVFWVLKIPYAFVMGIIIGIGNLIPFFGPIIATAAVFGISAVTIGWVKALWIVVLQFVLAQLDSNLLQPKILSRTTGISPLLVLVSVTVFGGFFGPVGMIVGVPVCAIVKMLVIDYLNDGKINGK